MFAVSILEENKPFITEYVGKVTPQIIRESDRTIYLCK